MLPLAAGTVFGVSMMSLRQIRRLGVLLFFVFFALTVSTPFFGMEIKGHPLDQPGAAVAAAFGIPETLLLPSRRLAVFPAARGQRIPGNIISIAAYLLVVAVLIKQPDLGMTVVLTATWAALFFIAGPSIFRHFLAGPGIAALTLAYFALPHVTERVDQFFDPATGDNYQIDRALEAFFNGGLYGRGPAKAIGETGPARTRMPISSSRSPARNWLDRLPLHRRLIRLHRPCAASRASWVRATCSSLGWRPWAWSPASACRRS